MKASTIFVASASMIATGCAQSDLADIIEIGLQNGEIAFLDIGFDDNLCLALKRPGDSSTREIIGSCGFDIEDCENEFGVTYTFQSPLTDFCPVCCIPSGSSFTSNRIVEDTPARSSRPSGEARRQPEQERRQRTTPGNILDDVLNL